MPAKNKFRKRTSLFLVFSLVFLACELATSFSYAGSPRQTIRQPAVQTDNYSNSLSVCDVLSAWIAESGKRFHCPQYLREIELPGYVNKGNRFALLEAFLEDHNTVWIWGKDKGLINVLFLDTAQTSSGIRTVATQNSGVPGMELDVDQLIKLSRLTFKKPLPNNIVASTEYREILQMAGVYKPEDWMEVTKALKVKKHIRSLLGMKKRR
jgi:hypothetical protein